MLHAGPSHSGDRRQHSQSSQSQSRQQLDPQLAANQSRSRSRSPGGESLLTIRIPTDRSRRGSVLHDRGQSESFADGLANLNRWSQSTTSSATSTDTPPTAFKPHHGFSGSIWARRSAANTAQSPEDVSPRSISISHARPIVTALTSTEYHRRRTPKLEKPLPPAMSLPSQSPGDGENLLTATSYTPSSAGLLTPASYNNNNNNNNHDYFGGSASYTDKSPRNMSRASSRAPSRAQSSMSRHHDSPVGGGSSNNGGGSGSGRKDKDKKAMLSKALEKANTAVLLDNALNYEGALEAYQDACRLLESVLERTGAQEDRRKLDAIRDTYTIRIEELLQIQMNNQVFKRDKQLPPRPMSDESLTSQMYTSDRDSAVIETATLTRIADVPQPSTGIRSSFLTSAIREVEGASSGGSFLGPLWERERSKSPYRNSDFSDHTARPTDELDSAFMPRPLTPRLKHHGEEYDQDHDHDHGHNDSQDQQTQPQDIAHELSADPVSWLDTIDESGSSSSSSRTNSSARSRSSVHSHNSQQGLHRRDLSDVSQTNLDFDAAFDAAVEAAYEDEYEIDQDFLAELPADNEQPRPDHDYDSPPQQEDHHIVGDPQLDDDEAEEERILEDITNDYIDHGFDFDIQSKSALPRQRQSDSSGYSRSTWQSSLASNRTTAGTSLSTVAENTLPRVPETASSHTPSPSLSDQTEAPADSTSGGAQQASVQSRRVAGPNFKQLKIETTRKPVGLRSRGLTNTEPHKVVHELSAETDRRISEVPSLRHVEAALASPYHMRSAASDTTTSMSLDSSVPSDSGDTVGSSYRSPRPRLFRGKTRSSVSLRDHAGFIPEGISDGAPASPMSTFQGPYGAGNDPLPTSRRYITPSAGSIPISRADSVTAGFYIFDDFLVPPNQPPSPGADDSFSPSSLEPCPESLLLRPFWLLRCIASTITQPRGGFLTTRLFVPHQVWMNRGVKLRNPEDKIANCDLLTAALGRLATVDTYDADAVLDELQSFEEVMERVQAVLVKKLGSEVGVQGVGSLFKDAPVSIDNTGTVVSEAKDTAKPSAGKSYLSSWRRLRGKNSTGAVTIPLSSTRGDKEAGIMASVPMSSFVPVDKRTAHRREASRGTVLEGPHKEYMGSVIRLCEAAQVLDQIARQVEDPGLKHSSPTHIGLEIGTRHAAEFFGFFICRFVLGDIGVLMDKYVKRSTEWIVA